MTSSAEYGSISQRSNFYGRKKTPRKRSVTIDGLEAHTEKLPAVDSKLGTFSGVFVPTTLNVLSILMYLRFGFVVGQTGLLGTLLLLVLSYIIITLTTLSISAISTNGTVRGGGAYYMISRSLGPEFGGSIGIVFYVGQVFNAAMNVAGFCEPLLANYGLETGGEANLFPEDYWWKFLYATILLLICTGVAMVGSSLFAKSSNALFVILIISTLSIPISVLFVRPFTIPAFGNAAYTGPSLATMKENLWTHFTKGAAGSSKLNKKESFTDIFGIFFSATSGIFAGASMSGDLRKPSRSIPKGTLWGLFATFILYFLVIVSLGTSVSRDLLHKDVAIIQDINMSKYIVFAGELSTSLFSALMGIVGAAKLLQAIALDELVPFAKLFSKGGDNPLPAVMLTYAIAQVTILFDINRIAVFVTMALLMTFVVTNLACFLLKLASAPNFRPSFRYFNAYTAGVGAGACILAMFLADGISASLMCSVLLSLFLVLHFASPQKPWGDVSQSLIYHQVRKYLLRLRNDHVKFWRPQILLLVDNPRTCWSLIHFCNHLKKGGLYILGHIVVTKHFEDDFSEVKRQQNAWNEIRDKARIKGFVQVAPGSTLVWGARNVYLGSGLGGMRPNITVLGFYEKSHYYPETGNECMSRFSTMGLDMEALPTDTCRIEEPIKVQEWVHIIEDLLTMQANVAVARGFPRLQFPTKQSKLGITEKTGYIDLYPIQMSAYIHNEDGIASHVSTNFDTYTLILQMGSILHTVDLWKKSYILRVIVFVEYEEDVGKEKSRISQLLEKLRIKADVVVLCLTSVPAYQTIVEGKEDIDGRVNSLIGDDEWWKELQNARTELNLEAVPLNLITPEVGSNQVMVPLPVAGSPSGTRRLQRRQTMQSLEQQGLSFSIRTNNIDKHFIKHVGLVDHDETIDSDVASSETESEPEESDSMSESSSLSNDATTDNAVTWKPAYQTVETLRRPTIARNKPSLLKNLEESTDGSHHQTKKKLKPNFSSMTTPSTEDLDDAVGNRTIMFQDDPEQYRSAKSRHSSGQSSSKHVGFDERTPLLKESKDKMAEDTPKPENFAFSRRRSMSITEEDAFLSFNDLPARAQHVILNDMMRQNSKKSVVLFSTLPAPTRGTYENEADCLDYVDCLDLWCRDLPPILLLHSQTMTVTTAL